MTLADLINKADSIARRFNSAQIPLDRAIDLKLIPDGYGGYFVHVKEIQEEQKDE